MAEPVNLNRFRKQKARAERKARADENAVKHGRTKAQKSLETARQNKDKIGKLENMSEEHQNDQTTDKPSDVLIDDVLSALVNLGYKEAHARKVLENMELTPGLAMEEVLKGALKVLVK